MQRVISQLSKPTQTFSSLIPTETYRFTNDVIGMLSLDFYELFSVNLNFRICKCILVHVYLTNIVIVWLKKDQFIALNFAQFSKRFFDGGVMSLKVCLYITVIAAVKIAFYGPQRFQFLFLVFPFTHKIFIFFNMQ
jgi:hypothetical protein